MALPSLSQVTELSMGEFLMHSSVVWLNPHLSLGRMRKDPDLTVFGELERHCTANAALWERDCLAPARARGGWQSDCLDSYQIPFEMLSPLALDERM